MAPGEDWSGGFLRLQGDSIFPLSFVPVDSGWTLWMDSFLLCH